MLRVMVQTSKAALLLLLFAQNWHGTAAASDEVCEEPSSVKGTAMLSVKRQITATKAAGQVEEDPTLENAEDLTLEEYHASQGMFKEEQVVEQPVPPEVHNEVVKLAQTGTAQEAVDPTQVHWLPVSDMNPSWSTRAYQIAKGFDHHSNTFAGAVVLVLDLAEIYYINKIRIDWRVCKCVLAGSHVIQGSTDGKTYMTIHSPKDLYVFGGHRVKEYTKDFRARFIRILTTAVSPLRWISWWELEIKGYMDPHRPNVYGWYHSYKGGTNSLAGTEILHLTPYKGQLFAGTGYWMNYGQFRAAEVARLDCPYCDWVVETQISPYAGRTELLKAIEWTTDKTGTPIAGGPISKLIAGFYLNWSGEGRCFLTVRSDDSKMWYQQYYWRKAPFKANYFSSRAAELYQDPVTKIDMLFFSTGMDGIVAGVFDPTSMTLAKFATTTESGAVETRPLGITKHDGRLYFSAASKIYRRTNGLSPSWSVVFNMADHDGGVATVDEAIGGIRGLTSIHNPGSPSSIAMLFSWVPNAAASGCVIRLDVDKAADTITMVQEKCVKDLARDWLGKNTDGFDALVAFTIADYNMNLQISDSSGGNKVQLIGFQIMLYAYSAHQFPTDPSQSAFSSSGKKLAYFAGAGYLIRRGENHYQVREPLGPRYNPAEVFPKLVAVRTLAESPFPGDAGAVYMGGYDCNHYAAKDTAWVVRGTPAAVFTAPVKCQKELGCGHTPGEPYQKYGCNLCGAREFNPLPTAYFDAHKRPRSCQFLLDFLNSPAGASKCANWKTGKIPRVCCKGCDMCAGTGKTLSKDTIAGRNSDGTTYTCEGAMTFIKLGHTTCIQGMIWWKRVCCK